MSFTEAPRVREIAERLIAKNYPHLQDSKDLINYYLRDAAPWYGRCHRCTGFERHITGKMFLIFIQEEAFNTWPLDRLTALIDHELRHIGRKQLEEVLYNAETGTVKPAGYKRRTEPESWFLIDHDMEEFADIIERHGLWETGVEKIAQSIRKADYQMTITDIENNQPRLKMVKP